MLPLIFIPSFFPPKYLLRSTCVQFVKKDGTAGFANATRRIFQIDAKLVAFPEGELAVGQHECK